MPTANMEYIERFIVMGDGQNSFLTKVDSNEIPIKSMRNNNFQMDSIQIWPINCSTEAISH